MTRTIINNNKILFCLLLVTTLTYSSCNKNGETKKPLVYNAESCVYGTMTDYYNNTWETIIELETGRFSKVTGVTEPSEGSLSLPIGVRKLTDFDGNKRIFLVDQGRVLVAQDLETFEKTTIELINPIGEPHIVRLLHLNFGANNDEIYGISHRSIFLINIATETITLIADNVPLDLNQVSDFLYLKERNEFVFLGYKHHDDAPSDYLISAYNPVIQEITIYEPIPNMFGLVKHPGNDQIFALTFPAGDKGFRLVKLQVGDEGINVEQISSANLDIDDLSPYIQTIHSASNSYVCKGGSSNFDNPQTYLYSINLNTGKLTNEAFLDGYKGILDLKGE